MGPARPIRETPKTIQETSMRTGQRWMAGGIRLAVASMALWLAACGGSGGGGPELRETAYRPLRGGGDGAPTGTHYLKGGALSPAPPGALRLQAPAQPQGRGSVRGAAPVRQARPPIRPL